MLLEAPQDSGVEESNKKINAPRTWPTFNWTAVRFSYFFILKGERKSRYFQGRKKITCKFLFLCKAKIFFWAIEEVNVTNWLSLQFLVRAEAILHAKSLVSPHLNTNWLIKCGWIIRMVEIRSQRVQRAKMLVMRSWYSAEKFVIKQWTSLWSTSQQSWTVSAHMHTLTCYEPLL